MIFELDIKKQKLKSIRKYMRKIIEKKNKGFISIFAIFFSAIVISILTSLYILLVKQIEIMNLNAPSFQALYVADSAFECALFKEQSSTSSDDSVSTTELR